MNRHIILTPEQAEQIKGRYGKYSAIEPIKTPDGMFIIPEKCLSDADLAEAKAKIEAANGEVQDIVDLPAIGQQVIGDRYYNYASENAGLVKCVQTHNRTIYPPEETPDLFSFFRPNTDELDWIPNEYVHLGWKRWYDGVQYEVIQAHMTLSTWTPDVTPALWLPLEVIGEQPPQWVSANWAQYTPIGYEVFDLGKVWKVKTLSHTWIQPALTGDGAISWTFVKDWI